jgi:hypothetical protein
MKSVFAKTLPLTLWADWTFQKAFFYKTIENAATECGLLDDLPDISRAGYLFSDFSDMWGDSVIVPNYRPVVLDYHNYILSIKQDPTKVMAHLYTWHMGDLFGGQMIKKIVDAPHRSLDFEDTRTLMTNIRSKLDDSMGDEANIAFDWAIRMMRDYDSNLG